MYLTEFELQMMHVIWREKKPITSAEILKQSINRGWKDNSLHPILQRLLKKGYIREDEIIREGRSFARTFLPIVSCEEYYASFLNEATKDAGIPALFSAIVSSSEIDNQALDRMQSELERIKRSLDKNA